MPKERIAPVDLRSSSFFKDWRIDSLSPIFEKIERERTDPVDILKKIEERRSTGAVCSFGIKTGGGGNFKTDRLEWFDLFTITTKEWFDRKTDNGIPNPEYETRKSFLYFETTIWIIRRNQQSTTVPKYSESPPVTVGPDGTVYSYCTLLHKHSPHAQCTKKLVRFNLRVEARTFVLLCLHTRISGSSYIPRHDLLEWSCSSPRVVLRPSLWQLR